MKLIERFPNIELDIFQIMPNHMHGIIIIVEKQNHTSNSATIGTIVGAYKSLTARECLNIYESKNETMGRLWQRNYYEHIIRNDKDMEHTQEYIYNNIANWKTDENFK